MRAAIVTLLVALLATTVARSVFADARTEGVAKAALKKAESDYTGMNYGTGASRIEKALRACGANKCGAPTRAALLRDLGTMQFKKGDKDAAVKSWTDALKLQPDIALNPAYDAPDVRAAFTQAKGGGQPSGDFAHTPAAEQKVNTPLPIYVEGGSDTVKRVVVKYQAAGASSWKRIDLKKVGGGWGGLIPCGDVQSGTMRYYVQGLDTSKEPVATNGDTKHPYTVEIKDDISGDAPHLPGMKAPKSCGESSDCPPDFPGCSKSGESAGANGDESGDSEKKADEGEGDKPAGPFKRVWLGLAGTIDFQSVPSGDDLCRLDPNTALPANAANMYCTNQDGTDFPSRQSPDQNNALVPGRAGHSDGGIQRGDIRLLLTLDYALTGNLLLGGRFGLVLYKYPGSAANTDGRAFSPRVHVEVRGTWLFGDQPLAKAGFAPMVFVGGGAAPFDAHTSSPVQLNTGQTGVVNLWQTSGPGFGMLGGGVRWALSDTIAFTAALRLNASFGANGLIPTFGPEIGGQYGF